MSDNATHHRWMNVALKAASQIMGHTAENPPVGCAIIDKDGHLAGVGHTAAGGRPHAETAALAQAGKRAEGGQAYVTLEPCAHHGKTPPCALALIKSGVRAVHIAIGDPDARVSGRGIAMLEEAGIITSLGIGSEQAQHQMAGFLSRQRKNRPFVTLKMASSADGFIAENAGEQTWLTGDIARCYVHDLRSRHDVILTASGTVKADNPQLNVRLSGWQQSQPDIAVLGRDGALKPDAALLQPDRLVRLYHEKGAKLPSLPPSVIAKAVKTDETGLSLEAILFDLAEQGYGRVMVEAGAKLATSLISANLIDELIWLKAPHFLETGIKAWKSSDDVDFSAPEGYIKRREFTLGADIVSIFHPDNRA